MDFAKILDRVLGNLEHLKNVKIATNVGTVGRHFQKEENYLFTRDEVIGICNEVSKEFLKEEMLVEIEINKGEDLNICGDLHGQLVDFFEILCKIGLPTNEKVNGKFRKYLFLGDYVDRGMFSIETICLLFLFKILYKEHIILLRGNHEDFSTNYKSGFKDECRKKYPEKFMKLHITFNGVFGIMPAAALINRSILCMHGGIGPTFRDLSQIRLIPRPTHVGSFGVLTDLLWADPEPYQATLYKKSDRGVSYTFNTEALTTFLKENNLLMIIRAHQCVEDGYKMQCAKQCVTVFSAKNYCGSEGNEGAVITIQKNGTELKCSITKFNPVTYSW